MSPYIFPTSSERLANIKIRLNDFDVTENGFLPSSPPLQSLPCVYYRPWEHLATELSRLVKEQTFRTEADNLPILSTQMLRKESEWRRAYVLLAFFTHAYIWGGDKPADV
jgi:indoleamine 2,3-dioxygenase